MVDCWWLVNVYLEFVIALIIQCLRVVGVLLISVCGFKLV